MKKFIALLLIFGLATVYIFYLNEEREKADQAKLEGPQPTRDIPTITLGGTIEDYEDDPVKIGEIQTSYIMYTKGDISFDDMVKENMEHLKDVLIFPFAPHKGYLFSSDYDTNSRIQVYYQSNQEETRTVVLKVKYNEDGNEVQKLYDGDYFKLVVVNEDDPTQVIGYDKNHEEHYIDVE